MSKVHLSEVDGIPVRWSAADGPTGVALWLTHLGGSAEQTDSMLTQLAEHGLLAVSFDPPGHGGCSTGPIGDSESPGRALRAVSHHRETGSRDEAGAYFTARNRYRLRLKK
jgi:alpha-beta hydrolase superfamily lysophospholipase